MGRYPFLAMIPRYLEEHAAVLCPETIKGREKQLQKIGRRLDELRKQGIISTTDPRKLTRQDALAIVTDMSAHGWKPSYLRMTVSVLKAYTDYCGNSVFGDLRARRLLPKSPEPNVETLTEKDLEKIQRGVEGMKGWQGEVARFLCAMYPATGLRPSELRRARIQDVDIENCEIHVVHPKGEGRYTSGRIAPILPAARETLRKYLDARLKYLAKNGIEQAEPLIPCVRGGKVSVYKTQGFVSLRRTMQKAAGVHFRFKDFRTSFAQRTIDLDPGLLSDVSKALGHKTTVTTERYYARIRDAPAIRRIQEAWAKADTQSLKAQFRLIDQKTQLSGYA